MKQFPRYLLTVLCLVSSLSWAEPKRIVYPMQNGMELVMYIEVGDGIITELPPSQIYLEGEGRKILLSEEVVLRFPIPPSDQVSDSVVVVTDGVLETAEGAIATGAPISNTYPRQAGARFVTYETADGIFLVTQEGVAKKLDVYMNRAIQPTTNVTATTYEFESEGRHWCLATVREFVEEEDQAPGETFLMRDDGMLTRIDFMFHDFDKVEVKINDGILDISSSDRLIDLRMFEAECRHVVRQPKMAVDGDGKPIADPLAMVETTFTDIVEEARRNPNYAFPVANDRTIRDLRISLNMAEKGSAVVLGEPGTGKTETVKTFAAMVAAGQIPELPRTTKMWKLDAASMASGTKYVGTYEGKLTLFAAASQIVPSFIFMDDMTGLRGGGTHSGNTGNDFFNMAAPFIDERKIRSIATAEIQRYNAMFGGIPAIRQRFGQIKHEPPTKEDIRKYMGIWCDRFEKTKPDQAVIDQALELAALYNVEKGSELRRSIELLQYAISMVEVDEGWGAKLDMTRLNAAAEELLQADPALLDPVKRARKLEEVKEFLESRLIGQRDLKEAVYEALEIYFSGINDPDRLAAAILAAGPSGTGKTLIAKLLAEVMGWGFKYIEMPTYANAARADEFLGEVKGGLMENAFTVFVWDEFDWASTHVQSAALRILEDGEFSVQENMGSGSDGGNQTLTLRANNAMVIVTTNAAQEYILEAMGANQETFGLHAYREMPGDTKGFTKVDEPELREAISSTGKITRAVIDRFDHVVAAYPATKEEFREIIELHFVMAFEELGQRKGLALEMGEQELRVMVDYLTGKFYGVSRSNRFARAIVKRVFRRPLAQFINSENPDVGTKLLLKYNQEVNRLQMQVNGEGKAGFEFRETTTPSEAAAEGTSCAQVIAEAGNPEFGKGVFPEGGE